MILSRTVVTVWIIAVLFFGVIGSGAGFLYSQAFSNSIAGQPRSPRLPIANDRTITIASTEDSASLFPTILSALDTFAAAPITTNTIENTIHIPSIDVRVPISASPTMNDRDILSALSEGVALYPNGITPGQPGLTFISGHSTGEPWKGIYRFAFLRLNELKEGDTISIDYDGFRSTYRVTGTRLIDPKVVQTIEATTDKPALSLMTCWPLWTTRNRLIVDAELVAKNPLIVQSNTPVDNS